MGLNIHQRLNEVRKSNPYIRKDKRVGEGGGYMAVTHDTVTAELRNDFIAQGILVFPSLDGEPKVVDTGMTTAKGSKFIRFEGIFLVTFVNMDNPSDHLTIRLPAHALDQGDKAPGKAISYAVKYAMLKVLNIETGEDEESRIQEPPAGGMPQQVEADWRARIDELSSVEEAKQMRTEMLEACKAVNDDQAYTRLRAHLTAKVGGIKEAANAR